MDGDTHTYEIWDNSDCGNDDFEIYIDYDLMSTSPSLGFCQGKSLTAGLELLSESSSGANSGEYSGTFDNYIETYRNSTGEWSDADFTTNTASPRTTDPGCLSAGENCITYPCAVYTGDVYCVHGLRVSADEWQDSKPQE